MFAMPHLHFPENWFTGLSCYGSNKFSLFNQQMLYCIVIANILYIKLKIPIFSNLNANLRKFSPIYNVYACSKRIGGRTECRYCLRNTIKLRINPTQLKPWVGMTKFVSLQHIMVSGTKSKGLK